MPSSQKKSALWHRLSEQEAPISLSELMALLGEGFSDRTVRRWLNEMAADGMVEKTGQKRGTRYRAIQAGIEGESPFGPDSLKAIERVKAPLYQRPPVTYNEKWFNAYRPNVSSYLPSSLKRELAAAGKRSKNTEPAGTYARHIYNRLLIDLSFNSSRLEGNTYSRLDTERLVLEGTSAEGKLDEEKVMILNHKEAIRYLVENADQLNVNADAICTLHYLLADGLVESRHAGKVRDHTVRISGSTYQPFEDPRQLQRQLERICGKAASIRDPFEQSLFLLVHISYLQAFSDVNKRTARLGANISLVKHNFVPLSFNDVPRNHYLSAMIACYELQEVGPIIDLFAHSYLRTCAMYDATVEALGFDEVRVRYREQRRAMIREVILRKLIDKPLDTFFATHALDLIPESDREAFLEDVREDLEQIDQSRIAGLGVTPAQLDEWLGLARRK